MWIRSTVIENRQTVLAIAAGPRSQIAVTDVVVDRLQTLSAMLTVV